jgi:thiol-disulfide isomerase/thioredoxin
MLHGIRRFSIVLSLIALAGAAATEGAEGAESRVTAAQALGLRPIQSDVDYDTPSEAEMANCSVQMKTDSGAAGWLVLDQGGQLLRRFLDTNGDNKIDLWCYYKGGIEVYRDIDADFNGKADQYRWLGTAGIRWGLDTNEDSKIERWKSISAEEVTAEAIAALATRDAARFKCLLPTPQELTALGLGEVQTREIAKKIAEAARGFSELATSQTVVNSKTKWLNFGANRPGVIAAGWEGATRDVTVYDNASAIVDTEGKTAQVSLGTLIQVDGGWRVIDLPSNLSDARTVSVSGGYFFQQAVIRQAESLNTEEGLSETVQKLLRELEKLDKALDANPSQAELAKLHVGRADVLEQLAQNASTADDRENWLRQLANGITASVQSGGYAAGVEQLKALYEKLKRQPADAELAAHVEFLYLSAQYSQQLQQPDADYPKIQDEWLANLARFVAANSKCEDAPEAMLQLAVGEEFNGKNEAAIAWYAKIAAEFPKAMQAAKAAGAKRRLESVGKTLTLSGSTLDGKAASLDQLRGRTVLIHYWATWCEPCKQDLTLLKQAQAKYAKAGFVLLGINLDSDQATAIKYLQSNPLSWPQMYEAGGLDSRLATELGILTLPTMLLIDKDGKVVNRNIYAAELDGELGKRLR